jgi:hypothetical protein
MVLVTLTNPEYIQLQAWWYVEAWMTGGACIASLQAVHVWPLVQKVAEVEGHVYAGQI